MSLPSNQNALKPKVWLARARSSGLASVGTTTQVLAGWITPISRTPPVTDGLPSA